MDLTDVSRAFSQGDLARPNLFEVEIPFMGQDLRFKCKAASMPGATVEPVVLGYQNKKMKLAGDRTFDDWTITVYNDTQHNTRQQFIDWQNIAQSLGRNINGEVPTVYKKEATVHQLDRAGNRTRSYTVYGCWPTQISELALDWDTGSEVEMFEIILSLDWWE
ncbi:tail tube protein [Aeromonas phage ZPAH1]|nr:tail tube protein [Aeromonas phage Aswh_1]QQG34034.1 tail tube protein [Aeromonas phage ZPAH1]